MSYNSNSNEIIVIPYTATSISILARIIFMFLLYKNKSTNNFSLIFCILSMCSSGMWINYSIHTKNTPLLFRSCTEVTLLGISCLYIVKNKIINNNSNSSIINHNNNINLEKIYIENNDYDEKN